MYWFNHFCLFCFACGYSIAVLCSWVDLSVKLTSFGQETIFWTIKYAMLCNAMKMTTTTTTITNRISLAHLEHSQTTVIYNLHMSIKQPLQSSIASKWKRLKGIKNGIYISFCLHPSLTVQLWGNPKKTIFFSDTHTHVQMDVVQHWNFMRLIIYGAQYYVWAILICSMPRWNISMLNNIYILHISYPSKQCIVYISFGWWHLIHVMRMPAKKKVK